MNALDHKIPPPIVVVLVGAAMWVTAQSTPKFEIEENLHFVIAGVIALSGFTVLALGIAAFRQAKTTINPVNPEAASSLVTGGIYCYTRNPMYVGFAALLVGWAAYLAVPWVLLGPIAFILFTTRFQIIPEEHVLDAKFGQAYSEYKEKVRRWL
ncbi:methyltransferase family protein [Phormidesmis sp. 146-33]